MYSNIFGNINQYWQYKYTMFAFVSSNSVYMCIIATEILRNPQYTIQTRTHNVDEVCKRTHVSIICVKYVFILENTEIYVHDMYVLSICYVNNCYRMHDDTYIVTGVVYDVVGNGVAYVGVDECDVVAYVIYICPG